MLIASVCDFTGAAAPISKLTMPALCIQPLFTPELIG
jgi:hypothetical protein